MADASHPQNWLRVTDAGLFCEPGNFYIDPLRPVARAVITHGHGDHARGGHGAVLATAETLAMMATRNGSEHTGATEVLTYGQTRRQGGVSIRLVPSGHILAAAQIVLEHGGWRVVVSGDYKRRADPTCPPFEPVTCDLFVTEAT